MAVLGETGLTELITLIKNKLAGYLPTAGGTITGNLTVNGTITGDVTGDLTGNADTATNATNATNDGNGSPIASTYLPLSGGTMTGGILANTAYFVERAVDDSFLYIGGASSYTNGTYMEIAGKDYAANPGVFHVAVKDASNTVNMWAFPDGRFLWNSKNVLTDATVGTVVSDTSSAVSVGTTSKSVVSISLSAGTWVVTGTLSYASIVAGRQFAGLNTSSTMTANTEGTVVHYSNTANNNTIALNVTRIFVLNSTTTVYLNGYSQSTVNTGTNTIRAVRIV